MDIERPRRTSSTPTTSELFICFTSRLSNSSSMRLSSKSILSPGRAADKSATSLSLSSSLSRRLRHNGSLRGAQSPAMFPSKKNKGGSGFDNPEPSSPKVTCIGQVRVKTKKQGKKMKMRACRSQRLSGGEASFRRIERAHEGLMHQNSQGIQNQQPDCGLNHRNQRWVHLPLTICEALRAFGAEFSCLLPCKSSCFSSCGGGGERDKVRERVGANNGGSCGAVFRWLVAVQEGEGEGEGEGKERDIELVVAEEVESERRERMMMGMDCSSRRRSIFDDMDFKDEIFDVKDEGEEDGAARVSMCVPPKNALLLMRCRSDPAKMSALSHKIWEAPDPHQSDEEYEAEEEEETRDVKGTTFIEMGKKTKEVSEKKQKLGEGGEEIDETCGDWVVADTYVEGYEMDSEDLSILTEANEQTLEETPDKEETEEEHCSENRGKTEQKEGLSPEEETQFMEGEYEPTRCSIDAITIRKMFEEGTKELDWMKNIKERETAEISDLSSSSSSPSSAEESTAESRETRQEEEENDTEFVKSMEKQEEEEEEGPPLEDQQELTHQRSEPMPAKSPKEEREKDPKLEELEDRENTKPVLPECLLLMMCEPKLSMEVSEETWVCSTDFIRWLPERHHSKKSTKTDCPDEPQKKKAPPQPSAQPVQLAVQPARSSISFPAGGLEHKMAKAGVVYEPFVLTRCKSAPIRSTAKIAATELACGLLGRENGRKMEPHRPATYGVGAAGVGF